MAKIEFSKIHLSLSRLPHWLAPVAFAFSAIAVISVLLIIITFIATAVSDASLVVDPPTPESILDTEKLSRIGPRFGLDGITLPNQDQGTDESSSLGPKQEAEIVDDAESVQGEGSPNGDGVKTPDNAPVDVPDGDSQ